MMIRMSSCPCVTAVARRRRRPSRTAADPVHVPRSRTWAREFKIILYAPDEETASKAADAAFARIASLDAIMSDYRPTSELMRLCAKAGGDPVPVSDELFFVLPKAEEVSRISDGAFDVTVGPVVRLWRLARRTQRMPDADKLAAALRPGRLARTSSWTRRRARCSCSRPGCSSTWAASPRATPPTRRWQC